MRYVLYGVYLVTSQGDNDDRGKQRLVIMTITQVREAIAHQFQTGSITPEEAAKRHNRVSEIASLNIRKKIKEQMLAVWG